MTARETEANEFMCLQARVASSDESASIRTEETISYKSSEKNVTRVRNLRAHTRQQPVIVAPSVSNKRSTPELRGENPTRS